MVERHLPAYIGPCEFAELGRQVAVRCPKELEHILQRAGASLGRGAGWCSGVASGQ